MDDKLLSNTSQYLFFILGEEKFALKTCDIQEIVDLINITRVPNSNNCVKGITNIRGELIPVVDAKIRFNKGEIKVQKRTSLIIVNIIDDDELKKIPIAMLVDSVLEVDEIEKSDILPSPVFGTSIEEKYIENIIRYNNEYISLLNIKMVLDIKELATIE